MSAPAVELKQVSRILSEEVVPVTLVEDVSCVIQPGEFISVTGPSGSGKSSLMYLIGLLDMPSSGSVWVDGQNMSEAGKEACEQVRLEKIGFVFQFHFLLAEFSAIDNVMLPMRKLGRLSPEAMRKRAEKLLSHFGLKDAAHKKPYQLSGGERQRVAIARAMANDPLIILADEPTGNLDTANSDIVFKLFETMVKEEGKTVITITHEPYLAKRAKRQLQIVDGRLVDEA